jgi:hypothetical protein
VGLKQTLDHLSALYVDGGVDIVTPMPEDGEGRLALRTVVQPDGDALFYLSEPVSWIGDDLLQGHGARVEEVVRSVGRLRILARGGQTLVHIGGAGFVLQSGLDYFIWGETGAALYGLAMAAAPLAIKSAVAGTMKLMLRRRFRRRL